jgi:hypothetical protein
LKTFCATLSVPTKIRAGQPIPITGWAQAGISGLKKVQVWIQNQEQPYEGARHYVEAPWRDAQILPFPSRWRDVGWENGNEKHLPDQTSGFVADRPIQWPLRLTQAHWATLHPGLPAGDYVLRCRTIDEQSHGQPMPRPFRKSGHAAIEERKLIVT